MSRILTITLMSAVALAGARANASDDESAPEMAAQWFGNHKVSAAPLGCNGARVALATHNGTNYLTAVAGGGLGVLANATKVSGFETFKVIDLGGDRVALQAANGRYLGKNPAVNNPRVQPPSQPGFPGAPNGNNPPGQPGFPGQPGIPRQRPGGGQGLEDLASLTLSASSPIVDLDATFKVSWSKDKSRLYLQTLEGGYVTAENGGGGLVDVAWPIAGDNQALQAICLDGGEPNGGGSESDSDDDVSSAGLG